MIRDIDFSNELEFKTSRSTGPGGQNVNKLETKVELRFSIPSSKLLSQEQKEILLQKLAAKITKDGDLLMYVQEKRTQLQNKELALKKFYDTLEKAFYKPKKRKATKPSKSVKRKRKEQKITLSEKKNLRKKIL